MIAKSLLLGLGVLAALIFGTPGLVGFYLARHFDAYAARIDQPGVMRVIGTRFERGWFNSSAQITVQLADRFCAKPPCATLTLDSTIHHGPLTFTAPDANSDSYAPAWAVVDSHLSLAPLWPRLVFEPPLQPLRVVTRVGLSGQVSSRLVMPPARFDVENKATIAHVAVAKLVASAQASLTGGPLGLTVSWPVMRITGVERGRFEIQGLRAELATAAQDWGRVVEQDLRINSLTLDNGGGMAARLERIVWEAEPVPGDDDGMATRFDSRIDRLIINSGEYGPLQVHGRIEGVDMAMWRALKQQFVAGEHSQGSNATALRTLYQIYLPPVLAAGPVFDIKSFSLATPAGEVSGRVRIAVPDDLRPPGSLEALLGQISLVFRGRLPTPLLRDLMRRIATSRDLLERAVTRSDIDTALALLAARGLVERLADGEAYRLRFALDHGAIRINGQQLQSWATLLKTLRDQYDTVFSNPKMSLKVGREANLPFSVRRWIQRVYIGRFAFV